MEDLLEERVVLHVNERTHIDICTIHLQFSHLLNFFLCLFVVLIVMPFRILSILSHVVVDFLNAILSLLEFSALQERRDDVVAHFIVDGVCQLAVLQLHENAEKVLNELWVFGIERKTRTNFRELRKTFIVESHTENDAD